MKMNQVLGLLGLGTAVIVGCGSSGDDAANGDSAISAGSCQVDLTTPGDATARGRLMAAVHASFLQTGVGPSIESQPNQYLVQSLVQDASGQITLKAKLESCTAGSVGASCQKNNPQGVRGGPIDWNSTTFPAAFKATAKAAGGFTFTAFLRTPDCGKTFSVNAELAIDGLAGDGGGDGDGDGTGNGDGDGTGNGNGNGNASADPCNGIDDALGICGGDVGKDKGSLFSCRTDDANRRVLYKACTCKASTCSPGAHQSGCECQEPDAKECQGMGDGDGICGQSIGKDSRSLFTCMTDDAGKRILALACTCAGSCEVGAHQGGCTCAQ